MAKPKFKIGDLRDLFGLNVSLTIEEPVPTARNPASRLLDEGDDVFAALELPGGIRVMIELTVGEYRALLAAFEGANAAAATRALALGQPDGD